MYYQSHLTAIIYPKSFLKQLYDNVIFLVDKKSTDNTHSGVYSFYLEFNNHEKSLFLVFFEMKTHLDTQQNTINYMFSWWSYHDS